MDAGDDVGDREAALAACGVERDDGGTGGGEGVNLVLSGRDEEALGCRALALDEADDGKVGRHRDSMDVGLAFDPQPDGARAGVRPAPWHARSRPCRAASPGRAGRRRSGRPGIWRSSASRVQAGMGLRRRGCAAETRARGRSAQASSRRTASRGGAGGDKERASEHGGGRDPAHDPAAVLHQLERHAAALRLVVEAAVRAVVARDRARRGCPAGRGCAGPPAGPS